MKNSYKQISNEVKRKLWNKIRYKMYEHIDVEEIGYIRHRIYSPIFLQVNDKTGKMVNQL
jgi:hypothetical protein